MQIAKIIYLASLNTMKSILDLLEFKLGKNTDDFQYAKKKVMDYTYQNLKKIFQQLEELKLIQKCPNHTSLRKGFKDCNCGGSSYIDYKDT